MSANPFIGEIALFPYTFAPDGWIECNGQVLAIRQWTALFSILGVNYGGNGSTTFALPNLNGRAAQGAGAGPGLTPSVIGEEGGSAAVTLVESQLPVHSHTTRAASGSASTQSPAGAVPATGSTPLYNSAPTTDQVLDPRAPAPHNNMQPSLVLRYCIAVQGIFPPRW